MSPKSYHTSLNREQWRLFRKRQPVNFLSPKALHCRLNQAIVQIITREDGLRLIAAFEKDKAAWPAICDEIEARLIRDGII